MLTPNVRPSVDEVGLPRLRLSSMTAQLSFMTADAIAAAAPPSATMAAAPEPAPVNAPKKRAEMAAAPRRKADANLCWTRRVPLTWSRTWRINLALRARCDEDPCMGMNVDLRGSSRRASCARAAVDDE
eukprot:scaffold308_cov176-Pinguiococcus_pyrenoidosus.AAC.4